jgi:hypothetical protein
MKLNDKIKTFFEFIGRVLQNTLETFLLSSLFFGLILIVSFIFEKKEDTIELFYFSIFMVALFTVLNFIANIFDK